MPQTAITLRGSSRRRPLARWQPRHRSLDPDDRVLLWLLATLVPNPAPRMSTYDLARGPPEPYDLSHPEVAAHLRPIFSLRGFTLPNKQVVLRALDLYSRYHFLDFGACRIVAGMRLRGIRSLFFYDAGFDKPPEFETGKLYLLPASPQAGRGIFCGIS